MTLAYLLDALLVVAIYAGLLGMAFFCLVLGARINDALFPDETPTALSIPSRAPEQCRFCGQHGWHDAGCGLLDRLDTPTTTTRETR